MKNMIDTKTITLALSTISGCTMGLLPDDDGVNGTGPAPAGDRVLGLHGEIESPVHDQVGEMFAGQRGWLVNLVYSTDVDWASDDRWNAATQNYNVALRIDYARGTSVPPTGGPCKAGDGGMAAGATHQECFANGIQTFVTYNSNVHYWIIGNEPNLEFEGVGFPGNVIPPERFAESYSVARNVIHAMPGHAEDIVFLGAVSPGPVTDVRHTDGETYLEQTLQWLGEVDGVAIHAYGGPAVGSPAATFKASWQEQLSIVDARFPCSAILISEFSATYSPNDGDPDVGGQGGGGSHFIEQAIADIREWNLGGNHPISGAVWFVWQHDTAFSDQRLRWWWDKRDEVGQTHETNWALAFQATVPTADVMWPDCEGGGGGGGSTTGGGQTCGDLAAELGWGDASCEWNGNGACGGAGVPTVDCDFCCQTQANDSTTDSTTGDPSCPCHEGVDNICFYLPEEPGCQDLMGIDQCTTDAQWNMGWYLYADMCGGGTSGGGEVSCGDYAVQQGWPVAHCEWNGNNACAGQGPATEDCEHCCWPTCGLYADSQGWGWANCEWNGNGACGGQGVQTSDCNHCCGG